MVQGSEAKTKPSPLLMRPQKAHLAGSPSVQSPRAPWEIKASTAPAASPLAKKYAATPGPRPSLHVCTSSQQCAGSQIFCRQTFFTTFPLCSAWSGIQENFESPTACCCSTEQSMLQCHFMDSNTVTAVCNNVCYCDKHVVITRGY